jgi:HPt (histidine-containing phosphotransfer) domain-containing protein
MKAEGENRVTNLDYLHSLSKGNTSFVQEMIRIFLEETPEEIHLMEKAIADQDYDLVKSTAHKLKSTIPFVGLDKLIDREVTEIEELATKKTDIQKIALEFDKIKKACERACLELMPI